MLTAKPKPGDKLRSLTTIHTARTEGQVYTVVDPKIYNRITDSTTICYLDNYGDYTTSSDWSSWEVVKVIKRNLPEWF